MTTEKVIELDEKEQALIRELVAHYKANQSLVSNFFKSVLVYIDRRYSAELKKLAHSVRARMKDADHLRDKLERKMREAKSKGATFDITKDTLLVQINDLAGVRILHLHTTQMKQIDKCIKAIIAEQPIQLIEGPSARTWDDEYRLISKVSALIRKMVSICTPEYTTWWHQNPGPQSLAKYKFVL